MHNPGTRWTVNTRHTMMTSNTHKNTEKYKDKQHLSHQINPELTETSALAL